MHSNAFDFGAQLVFFLTAVLRGEYAAPHYAVATARMLLHGRFDLEAHAIAPDVEDDGWFHERHQMLFDLQRDPRHNLRYQWEVQDEVRLGTSTSTLPYQPCHVLLLCRCAIRLRLTLFSRANRSRPETSFLALIVTGFVTDRKRRVGNISRKTPTWSFFRCACIWTKR